MAVWQVQEAKAHLGKVIEEAYKSGPQTITLHGVPQAVLLSVEDYRNLAALRFDFKPHGHEKPKPDEIGLPKLFDADSDPQP